MSISAEVFYDKFSDVFMVTKHSCIFTPTTYDEIIQFLKNLTKTTGLDQEKRNWKNR
jgi:hypothetical protein